MDKINKYINQNDKSEDDENENIINQEDIENIKIKKIIKYRKVAFTEHRNNYKKYHNAKWKWDTIMEEIEIEILKGTKEFIKIISQKYNIAYGTLRRKYSEYRENKNNNEFDIDSDKRGGKNKIFTEIEEKELYLYIKNVFIDTKLILLNEHIRLLAIIKYFLIIKNTNINNLSLCEENDNFFISDNKNLINISETWVSEFKKRWKLSSLKTKINRKAVKNM